VWIWRDTLQLDVIIILRSLDMNILSVLSTFIII